VRKCYLGWVGAGSEGGTQEIGMGGVTEIGKLSGGLSNEAGKALKTNRIG